MSLNYEDGQFVVMYSTIYLFVMIAFYVQYNRSRRSRLAGRPAYLKTIEQYRWLSHIISATLMVAALIWLVCLLGLGSGAFGFVVILLSAGCLIVLLASVRYIRLMYL